MLRRPTYPLDTHRQTLPTAPGEPQGAERLLSETMVGCGNQQLCQPPFRPPSQAPPGELCEGENGCQQAIRKRGELVTPLRWSKLFLAENAWSNFSGFNYSAVRLQKPNGIAWSNFVPRFKHT